MFFIFKNLNFLLLNDYIRYSFMCEGKKPIKAMNRPVCTGNEMWFYFPCVCVWRGGGESCVGGGNIVIASWRPHRGL